MSLPGWRAARARAAGRHPTGEEEDLRQRIRLLEERIAVAEQGSGELGGLLNDLGNRWRDLHVLTGDRPAIDSAVRFYRRAMELFGGTDSAHLAAGNLSAGLLGRYLTTGDLGDLDAAVHAAGEAVSLAPLGSADHARHLANLANALHERFQRTRQASDADAAVTAAEEAATMAPGTPEALAGQVNLAVALLDRQAEGDRQRAETVLGAARERCVGMPRHFLTHVDALLAQIQARTPPAEPSGDDGALVVEVDRLAAQAPRRSTMRAAALHTAGKARWEQYLATRQRDLLDTAISALQAAVGEAPDGAGELPMYLNDLGIALSELSFVADSSQGLAQGVAAWVRALNLLDERFDAVAVPYKLGQETASVELGIAGRVVAAYLTLADRAVSNRDAMVRNALWVAEGTKARLMTDLIGRGDLPAPPGGPPAELARERELLGALQALDTAATATYGHPQGPGDEDGRGQREALRRELEAVWETLASSGPAGQDFVSLRRRPAQVLETVDQLGAMLGPSTALASIFSTPTRTVLFVIRPGEPAPTVSEVTIDRAGWLKMMSAFDREVRAGYGTGEETWDEPMQELLRSAAVDVAGAERVVVAPAYWGVQLPWAAISRRAGWRAPDRGPMPVVTVESLSLLHRLMSRRRARGSGAVVVGDPSGNLAHARSEAVEVAGMLGVEPLIGADATKAAVRSALEMAAVVHIAGHAAFERADPLGSGIVLADGRLTAREIMAESIGLDVLVLSACETGVADALAGNEFAGLSQAFHIAGVRTLVASLWKVDDPATAAVMSRFYSGWLQGSDLGRSLRQAMAPPDSATVPPASADEGRRDARVAGRATAAPSSTYYWESFVLSGDWAVPWPA